MQKKALVSLGALAVYACKMILPEIKQGDHFKLGLDVAGLARANLRQQLGKELGLCGEDLKHFLFEAISVIIPLLVKLHQDTPNDSGKNMSGTLTLNCTLPMDCLDDKTATLFKKQLGFIYRFPCCVVFYTRSTVKSYSIKEPDLVKLENTSTLGRKIHEAIVATNTIITCTDSRSFIKIFDSPEALQKLNERISTSFHSNQNGVEVPFRYEVMVSTIVFDRLDE